MAASGITASWDTALGGRVFPPSKGGTRMYITNGMSREATQGLGGRKTPGVMDSVYNKAKSEEGAPEMRGAIGRACRLLAVESFVQDLDLEAFLADESGLGADRVACTTACFHRCSTLQGRFLPSVVLS